LGHGAAINAPVSALSCALTTPETLSATSPPIFAKLEREPACSSQHPLGTESYFEFRTVLRESGILKKLVTPYLAFSQRFDLSLVSAMFALKAGTRLALWDGGSAACEGLTWQSQQ
jgi:hypothetical protein